MPRIFAFRISSLSVIELLFLYELACITVSESSGILQSKQFLNQEVADFQHFLEEKLSNQLSYTNPLNREVADFQKFLEEKLSNQGPPTDSINEEVADFQKFLEGKLFNQDPQTHNQENVQHFQQSENLLISSNDDWDASDESVDLSYEDVQGPSVPTSIDEPPLTSAENEPQLNPSRKRKNDSRQRVILHQNNDATQGNQSSLTEGSNHHHPVKEILYIRESDSDLTGSLPDILEEVLLQGKQIGESIEPKEPSLVQKKSLSGSLDDELSLLRPDTCSGSNHSFYDGQTCSSGHEYKLEPHLSATYSEDLYMQMKEKYSPRQQTVCGFRRRMRPDKDVTERALCPFQWVVSSRNSSRIPEYLYEAKCDCQHACAELKSKIRVLWRVGCEDQLHVYKEGWEEIAVACVPTQPPITMSKKAHRVMVTQGV